MMTVEIETLPGSVRFRVPPNRQFARLALSMGGSFDGDCWTFGEAQELEVRELCRHIFNVWQEPRDRHASRWPKR